MKLTVFASGSTGNCCLVQGGGENVLIDAGISAARIRAGLARAGLMAEDLAGIFITHEHSDHIKGLPVFLKRSTIPLYAPGTVAAALRRAIPGADALLRVIEPERAYLLGGLSVTAFPTPHDTMQSVGYRMEAADGRFALATDTGCVTDTMLRYLSDTDVALIEANHDLEMLRNGRYPPMLKKRILSDRGHLSNTACAELAGRLAQGGTGTLVLGHLSKENNLPALALKTVLGGVTGTDADVVVAPELGFLEVGAACFASACSVRGD